MPALVGRMRLGFVDLAERPCGIRPCPDARPDEAHIHLAVTKIRRWHPGYWFYFARAILPVLGSVRIRRAR